EELKRRIYATEPELILVSYNDAHTAIYQLLDCDGYSVGRLTCLGVRAIFLSSRNESYDKLEVFSSQELPPSFSWLSRAEMEGRTLFVFRVLSVYEYLSLLPVTDGERRGYIVCDSIEYER